MSRLLACAFMFGISVAAISGLRAQSTLRIVESYVYKIDNVMKPKNLVQLDVADDGHALIKVFGQRPRESTSSSLTKQVR